MIAFWIIVLLAQGVRVRVLASRDVGVLTVSHAMMAEGTDTLKFRSLKFRARNGYVVWGNRISRKVTILPLHRTLSINFDGETRRYTGELELTAEGDKLVPINIVNQQDYLASVVGSEMTSNAPIEALKTQAVLARTFLFKFRGQKHTGFDFCDLTHCMHYNGSDAITPETSKAVRETEGLVIVASDGTPVEPYFSASNGGKIDLPSKVWGTDDPDYLSSKDDPFSATVNDRNRIWRTEIPISEIEMVFGITGLMDIDVDTMSSPMMVELIGNTTLRIRAADFKIRLNRAIGWNKIKSVRFSAHRRGSKYVFEGKGLGHGIGLSQAGAIEMARRGYTFEEILGFYFPGAWLRKGNSPFFYRGRISKNVHSDLKQALTNVESSLSLRHSSPIYIVAFKSVGEFTDATNQPWWKAAVTIGDTIYIQLFEILRKRGIYAETMRRELYHVILNQKDIELPLWLREGLATLLFGNHQSVSGEIPPPQRVELMLRSNDKEEFRRGWVYSAALAKKYLSNRDIKSILSSKQTGGM